MQRIRIAFLVAVAVLAAETLSTRQATAMTAGAAPAGLWAAIAETDAVLQVSCFRNGWRGWATYSKCEKHVRKRPRKGTPTKK